MTILAITTGGTIGALAYDDPLHPPELSSLPTDGSDRVHDALTHKFSQMKCRYVAAEPRDSKLIDDAYLQNLVRIIESAAEDKILITHGTDRILPSAGFFFHSVNAQPTLKDKRILLTGAMIPLANGSESDGYQNLEFSLQHLQGTAMTPGVYIVLSDYENPDAASGAWRPRLYPYPPGAYEKVYTPDARYNRLRRI